MVTTLRPIRGEPLTFWHVAGDILWRGSPIVCLPITVHDADALRDLYACEVEAARLARDDAAEHVAVTLWLQLTEALTARDAWARAARAA